MVARMATDPFRQTMVQIKAANAGDRDALNDLLSRYQPWVRKAVAQRLGRNHAHDRADEIVQESLLDAFRAIHRFEDRTEQGFRQWLAQIVLNNVRDSARRRLREQGRAAGTATSSPASSIAARDPRPSQNALVKELEQHIHDALVRLPPLHREIMKLRDRDGLDDAAIAAKLGYKNADTVRALYHRARRSLRQLLEDAARQHSAQEGLDADR
jgi:RNA polymerase sigma-70 factor (ECF subfamily)